MGFRFKVLAGLYLLLLLVVAHSNGALLFGGGIGDIFVGLGSLLVFAVIALWPTANAGDNVDRAMSGNNWADRVEFDERPRE